VLKIEVVVGLALVLYDRFNIVFFFANHQIVVLVDFALHFLDLHLQLLAIILCQIMSLFLFGLCLARRVLHVVIQWFDNVIIRLLDHLIFHVDGRVADLALIQHVLIRLLALLIYILIKSLIQNLYKRFLLFLLLLYQLLLGRFENINARSLVLAGRLTLLEE
jgi:hypothetical protein